MVDSGTFKTSQNLQSSKHLEALKTDALLSGSTKDKDTVRRHIDPSVELGRLDICFGGFSPTVMRDISETCDDLVRFQESVEERRNEIKKASLSLRPRKSDLEIFDDGNGAIWKYYVLEDDTVYIERCECEEVCQLIVPETIKGMKVVALGDESCAKLEFAEEIAVPDSVTSIGFCAFRDCQNLRRIRFPKLLEKFDSGWLRGCVKLEEVHLPGLLEKITPAIFDIPGLKVLHIGAGTFSIMPGAFAKSSLEHVDIDQENKCLESDGRAIYSEDGIVMIALAVPGETYSVRNECKALAKKAFSNFCDLRDVDLPETIELIGDYAFAKTSIKRFVAPRSLKIIGERAFFACKDLTEVVFDKGILAIGNHAFTDTGIEELRLPSTIVELGNPIADNTSLDYSGPNATFSIAGGKDARMSIDEGGAIYIKENDGMHLVRMLEKDAEGYALRDDTVAIDSGAFAKHPGIKSVVLNEGLKSIGKGAFKGCRTLRQVNLPSSLKLIDDEAFLDTSIEDLNIPAALDRIGSVALITYGAHHGSVEPTLRHVTVDAGNSKYYIHDGLLIEHMDNGKDRVILCTGETENVSIPESVTAIASYAFNGVRRLKTLSLTDKIVAIDVRGLAFDSLLELIHVDLEETAFGHSFFEFEFPSTSRSAQQMALVFGSPSFINVENIFDGYDNSIVSRTGFGGGDEDGKIGAYEQGRRIVERLKDPIFMSPTNRGLMESVLRSHIDEICIDVAKHDDKLVIEGLLDLGYINDDNIESIIDAVGRIQDASITNYLLEQKRSRFGANVLDFEL